MVVMNSQMIKKYLINMHYYQMQLPSSLEYFPLRTADAYCRLLSFTFSSLTNWKCTI